VKFEVSFDEIEVFAERAMNMPRKQIGEFEEYTGKRIAADEAEERRRRGQLVA
jgi:hypothetical protein